MKEFLKEVFKATLAALGTMAGGWILAYGTPISFIQGAIYVAAICILTNQVDG